ncbi:MAG: SANT/Myb-like DNA-binding domain-containing protein, partial [Brevundimonas sp.]
TGDFLSLDCQHLDTLWDAIARIIQTFSPQECRNYFSAAGYDAT